MRRPAPTHTTPNLPFNHCNLQRGALPPSHDDTTARHKHTCHTPTKRTHLCLRFFDFRAASSSSLPSVTNRTRTFHVNPFLLKAFVQDSRTLRTVATMDSHSLSTTGAIGPSLERSVCDGGEGHVLTHTEVTHTQPTSVTHTHLNFCPETRTVVHLAQQFGEGHGAGVGIGPHTRQLARQIDSLRGVKQDTGVK